MTIYSTSKIINIEKAKKEEKEEIGRLWWYESFAVFSVCSACISCGTFLGYTSPAIPSMQNDHETFDTLEPLHIALIGGLVGLSAMLGSLLAILPLKYFGPRRTIGMLGIPTLLAAWITIGLSKHILQVLAGRFLGGIGVGATIACAPLYVIDVSSTSRRGKMGIMPQFLMISGILIVYCFGTFLDWSNLALVLAMFAKVSGILILFAPDSPKYLISKGKIDQATLIIKRIQGQNNAEKIVHNLQKTVNFSTEQFTEPKNIWTLEMIKPILICLGIISIQQLTGINGITFFASTIFDPSSNELTASLSPIILASTQLIASFLSTLFVERFGRTFLLKMSTIIITISATGLGFYFYFLEEIGPKSYWIPLAFLITFAFGFAIGLGPVTWILVAELLPQATRQLVNPFIICYNWLCVCIVTTSFPWLKNWIDFFGIFWLYAAIALVGLVFVFIYVPETKGKSSSDIQQHFVKKGNFKRNLSIVSIGVLTNQSFEIKVQATNK